MTSETRQIISTIRTELLAGNVLMQSGFDNCFRDPETGLIYLRNYDNELARFGIHDNIGNFFYIRYDETERAQFRELPRTASCKEMFEQTLALRVVFVYTATEQYEACDYLINKMMGVHVPNFNNVSVVKVSLSQAYYDYANWDGDDTANEIRAYNTALQSCAIDINVTFAREFDNCRQPPQLPIML